MKENLGLGHMGNGITVWDSNQNQNNDYKTVAHIDRFRSITYYDDKLSDEAKAYIESYAKFSNMYISSTQKILVLNEVLLSKMDIKELKEWFIRITKDPELEVVLFSNEKKILVMCNDELTCVTLQLCHRHKNTKVEKGIYHWLFKIYE